MKEPVYPMTATAKKGHPVRVPLNSAIRLILGGFEHFALRPRGVRVNVPFGLAYCSTEQILSHHIFDIRPRG